jgi:hypothetical protein
MEFSMDQQSERLRRDGKAVIEYLIDESLDQLPNMIPFGGMARFAQAYPE